jgi:hypothetical protein
MGDLSVERQLVCQPDPDSAFEVPEKRGVTRASMPGVLENS